MLQVGAVSPRGLQARGVAPAKALETASGLLQATGAARDTDEAAFWLKRYLGQSIGEERSLRALTQLGSAYAEPSSAAADFVKARQLWEIAGAAGDPVALCFLGTLQEHGLGVPQSRTGAYRWYERAKQAGGCPSIDEALARNRP